MLPLMLKLLIAFIEEAPVIERLLRNAGTGAAIVLVVASSSGMLQWLAPYNDVFVFGA